jgi:hypothetical protein
MFLVLRWVSIRTSPPLLMSTHILVILHPLLRSSYRGQAFSSVLIFRSRGLEVMASLSPRPSVLPARKGSLTLHMEILEISITVRRMVMQAQELCLHLVPQSPSSVVQWVRPPLQEMCMLG